jgi:N6-L-threonylcarbamoyladenine synthase
VLLALESSCDETSAAVVQDGRVLSNVVASQIRLHSEYGGVVPELATREHLRNLPSVVHAALDQAGVAPAQLSALAATRGPGLPLALMIGYRAAQTMAFALGKPFLGLHHHEAHLYSPWIDAGADWGALSPHVALIVSGGHTLLLKVERFGRHRVLGGTVDDAAGECFDKTAKLLGLPYPGGPEMDRLARSGRADAHEFPRPLLNDPSDDFSFSGLKTSVRYFLDRHPEIHSDAQRIRDVCASVQEAIVGVLVGKLLRAARREGVRVVTVSGGVGMNSRLRALLPVRCAEAGLEWRFAPAAFSTDNAAMIGVLAEAKLRHGAAVDSSDADVLPGWPLEALAAT